MKKLECAGIWDLLRADGVRLFASLAASRVWSSSSTNVSASCHSATFATHPLVPASTPPCHIWRQMEIEKLTSSDA